MGNKLVSIVTPCYNGEAYLPRFFDTILNQTYPCIELIFINDGSTDATTEIIEQYRPQLAKRGISFQYIYQENAGQAAAINKGLKVFQGDYIIWTDSDDILHNRNVEKKVAFMEEHKEYGYAMCKGEVVTEDDVSKRVDMLYRHPPKGEDSMFLDLLIERNVVFTPGVYIARREAFLDAHPTLHIYESRIGQNWQLLLPLASKYQCGYIEEVLFSYVIRSKSHSRTESSEEEVLRKYENHKKLLLHLLSEMQVKNITYYKEVLEEKYIRMQLNIASTYRDIPLLKTRYCQLKKKGALNKRDRVVYWSGKIRIIEWTFHCAQGMKCYLKKIRG